MIADLLPHRPKMGLVHAVDGGGDGDVASEESFGVIAGVGRVVAAFKHCLEAGQRFPVGIVADAEGGFAVAGPAVEVQQQGLFGEEQKPPMLGFAREFMHRVADQAGLLGLLVELAEEVGLIVVEPDQVRGKGFHPFATGVAGSHDPKAFVAAGVLNRFVHAGADGAVAAGISALDGLHAFQLSAHGRLRIVHAQGQFMEKSLLFEFGADIEEPSLEKTDITGRKLHPQIQFGRAEDDHRAVRPDLAGRRENQVRIAVFAHPFIGPDTQVEANAAQVQAGRFRSQQCGQGSQNQYQ